MKTRLNAMSYVGIGMLIPMICMMTGTLSVLGWWTIQPPLRFVVMCFVFLGVALHMLGHFKARAADEKTQEKE